MQAAPAQSGDQAARIAALETQIRALTAQVEQLSRPVLQLAPARQQGDQTSRSQTSRPLAAAAWQETHNAPAAKQPANSAAKPKLRLDHRGVWKLRPHWQLPAAGPHCRAGYRADCHPLVMTILNRSTKQPTASSCSRNMVPRNTRSRTLSAEVRKTSAGRQCAILARRNLLCAGTSTRMRQGRSSPATASLPPAPRHRTACSNWQCRLTGSARSRRHVPPLGELGAKFPGAPSHVKRRALQEQRRLRCK